MLDEKFPDEKGDVYSFAIILWELAARTMPCVLSKRCMSASLASWCRYPPKEWKFDYKIAAHVLQGGRLPMPPVCPPKWAEVRQREFILFLLPTSAVLFLCWRFSCNCAQLIFHCWAQAPADRPAFSDILLDLDKLREGCV